MRTYVSTMGFHETRVTRPILRHGLHDDDLVVLLRPATETMEDRGEDAVDYVEDMLHEMAPESTIEVHRIDQSSFETAVLECSNVLLAADGELVVNLGGGAREIYLPLAVATIIHATSVNRVLQYTDIDQDVREWLVPNITASVSETVWPTLDTIVETGGEMSIPEVTEAGSHSKSTITRHVKELEDAELVDSRMEGNTKYVSPSTAGKLLRRSRRS